MKHKTPQMHRLLHCPLHTSEITDWDTIMKQLRCGWTLCLEFPCCHLSWKSGFIYLFILLLLMFVHGKKCNLIPGCYLFRTIWMRTCTFEHLTNWNVWKKGEYRLVFKKYCFFKMKKKNICQKLLCLIPISKLERQRQARFTSESLFCSHSYSCQSCWMFPHFLFSPAVFLSFVMVWRFLFYLFSCFFFSSAGVIYICI